jgi:hypothetical protein
MGAVAEVRPATREDVLSFYGRLHRDTVKAVVEILDGKIIAIGGVRFAPDMLVAFASFTEEARRFPVRMVKECRALLNTVGHCPVYAITDTGSHKEERLLEVLGFRPYVEEIWRRN